MDEKFIAILSIALVPQIIELIIKNENINEDTAIDKFYQSKTYEKLEVEETKMWHFSALTLYHMWKHEMETGELLFPEE